MKHLIVTGDDFGRSHAVNEAIEHHHEAGLLTQASLMVNEACVDEAVRIARRHPQLCVGVHLTLCAGRASGVSALTDRRGGFHPSPALAGLRYAFDSRTESALAGEITAQFRRFAQLGFPATHLDGHTHLHLHPRVFRLTLRHLSARGFKLMRLVHEPGNRTPVGLIFRALSGGARRVLGQHRIRAVDRVYGLRASGRMTTAHVAQIIEQLPEGLSELYFHPGAEPGDLDLPRLCRAIERRAIALTSAATLPPPQSAV